LEEKTFGMVAAKLLSLRQKFGVNQGRHFLASISSKAMIEGSGTILDQEPAFNVSDSSASSNTTLQENDSAEGFLANPGTSYPVVMTVSSTTAPTSTTSGSTTLLESRPVDKDRSLSSADSSSHASAIMNRQASGAHLTAVTESSTALTGGKLTRTVGIASTQATRSTADLPPVAGGIGETLIALHECKTVSDKK
jgi:hypothetical protein